MSNLDQSLLGMRASAVALLLAIFTSGAFAGAGLYRWALHDQPMGPPEGMGPGIMHWELGLSLEQQQKVEAAMQKYRPELDAVIRETFPRVKAVQEKIDNEIRALLTEGQRRKFDEMQSRRPPGAGSRPGPDSPYPGGPPPFMPSGHRFGPPGEMPPPSMSAPIAPPKG